MKLRAIFATILLLGIYFLALPVAMADATRCNEYYTEDIGNCYTNEINADNTAWNQWDADNSSAITRLNSTLAQDLTNFNNSVSQCHIDYSNHLATCRTTYNTVTAAAWETESNQLAACQSQYSDTDPQLYFCICPDIAAYNYANSVANANFAQCEYYAENSYSGDGYSASPWQGLCPGTAAAIKSEDDSSANATYNYSIGAADAVCDATRTMDGFTEALCYDQAACNLNNCMLDVDCGQTPANCCQDGCAKTWNNNYLSANSTYLNTVGPATFVYILKSELCPVSQQGSDAVGQYTAQFAIDNAAVKRGYDEGQAYADYGHTIAMDDAAANNTIAICACDSGGNTSDTQYVACATQAIATQTNDDAIALAAEFPVIDHWDNNVYNSTWVVGSATIAYTTTRSNALATAQAAYTTDYTTMTNCLATAQSTLQSVTDSANFKYNNDMDAAWQALVNCLQACNGGQG